VHVCVQGVREKEKDVSGREGMVFNYATPKRCSNDEEVISTEGSQRLGRMKNTYLHLRRGPIFYWLEIDWGTRSSTMFLLRLTSALRVYSCEAGACR